MNKIKIEIGDWSGDGHGISEIVEITANRTIDDLKQLYKKSCELTGLQFTTNGDESGRNRNWEEMSKWKVLQEYQEDKITEFQKNEFAKYGIEINDLDFSYKTEKFTKLFLNFLSLSDEEFRWVLTPEKQQEKTLQLFIGYGIYD